MTSIIRQGKGRERAKRRKRKISSEKGFSEYVASFKLVVSSRIYTDPSSMSHYWSSISITTDLPPLYFVLPSLFLALGLGPARWKWDNGDHLYST